VLGVYVKDDVDARGGTDNREARQASDVFQMLLLRLNSLTGSNSLI
jgi:hypothetical protein